jgi:hypothetical protein
VSPFYKTPRSGISQREDARLVPELATSQVHSAADGRRKELNWQLCVALYNTPQHNIVTTMSALFRSQDDAQRFATDPFGQRFSETCGLRRSPAPLTGNRHGARVIRQRLEIVAERLQDGRQPAGMFVHDVGAGFQNNFGCLLQEPTGVEWTNLSMRYSSPDQFATPVALGGDGAQCQDIASLILSSEHHRLRKRHGYSNCFRVFGSGNSVTVYSTSTAAILAAISE